MPSTLDPAEYAIVARGLVKRYGDNRRARRHRPRGPAGTVTAVLGPNGAGKTTAVRILTTLTEPPTGYGHRRRVRRAHPTAAEVRRRIGLAAQDATVDPLLTGRENLVMLGELHQLAAQARRRPRRRAARGVLAHRRRRPGGVGLLRRHAPAPRPRRHARRRPRGAVPRRADDRPRPAGPHRAVGRARHARRPRHHAAADHPVPRRGRAARRRHHRHRPRPRSSPAATPARSSARSAATTSTSSSSTPTASTTRRRSSPP